MCITIMCSSSPPLPVVSLQPYCDQIDQVEASVSALEQTAYRLDAYCKRLGESVYLSLHTSSWKPWTIYSEVFNSPLEGATKLKFGSLCSS